MRKFVATHIAVNEIIRSQWNSTFSTHRQKLGFVVKYQAFLAVGRVLKLVALPNVYFPDEKDRVNARALVGTSQLYADLRE